MEECRLSVQNKKNRGQDEHINTFCVFMHRGENKNRDFTHFLQEKFCYIRNLLYLCGKF